MTTSGVVYTSEHGRMCPACERPIAACSCRSAGKKRQPASGAKASAGRGNHMKSPAGPPADGIARVQRECKGRGGKTVTTISGLSLPEPALQDLATTLKRRCGTGGSVKDGVIVIQGDHGDVLIAELAKAGFTAKRAGG
jgi:translation initiation factor 1